MLQVRGFTTFLLAALLLGREAQAFYNPQAGRWLNRDPIEESGGPNVNAFVWNCAIADVDSLGMLAASVESIQYHGHGSAERNGTIWQYISVDDAIRANNGAIPLNVSATTPAASVSLMLDGGFNARIVAWTALSRDNAITALQMSADLAGTVKVCCWCPFKTVRANWSAQAAVKGTVGGAFAQFDAEKPVRAKWNRPGASESGVKDKALNASYCATFSFVLGGGWTDVSKKAPTTSTVSVQASFECID